jgi:single-strand DNA-binding protein
MSDTTQIRGTVETCLDLETFASGFTKRVLVINTGGDYPQMVPVEFVKDKTELLTGLRKGQEVTAHVNIRGNEYNGKYYANIQGWKLDKGDGGQAAPKQESKPAPAKDDGWAKEDAEDEIPF